MTADPIQAAKERLIGDFNLSGPDCPPGLYCKINGQWATKVFRADLGLLLAELSRLQGESAVLGSDLKTACEDRDAEEQRAIEAEAALAEARRQIAERDEALKLAERDLSCSECGGTGAITTYLDELDECPKCHGDVPASVAGIRALLSQPPGGGEKAGIMAHMPSRERLREQIAADPDACVEAGSLLAPQSNGEGDA